MADSALVHAVQTLHAGLAVPVDRWWTAVRAWNPKATEPSALLESLVLPLQGLAPALLDLDDNLRTAGLLATSADEKTHRSIQQRLRKIVAELLGAEAELQRRLSDIVCESASYRTLLSPRDQFDVSAVSALVALALANYAHGLDHFRRRRARPMSRRVLAAIYIPLACCTEAGIGWRPGDVWFLELAARTVCQGEGLLPAAEQAVDVSENGPPSASALTQLVAPRFVALSLLHKLLAAGRVPRWLLNQGQYKLWPGLPQLLADPGAEWLRTLTLGELARVLAGDHAGIVQAAAIRFIAAVLEVPEPALQIWGRLFLAQLFWETLDLDRELLGRLFQQPRLSATLRAALAAVEQPVEPFAEFPDACHQLVETRILLHTIDQYDALTALATAAGKPRRPTPAPALTL